MEPEDNDFYSLEKIDAILQEMKLKLSWIETGKAYKYKELPMTFRDIAVLAEQIVTIARQYSDNGRRD